MEWVSRNMPLGHSETQKLAMKEVGTPDVRTDTRLNESPLGQRNKECPYHIRVWLSRNPHEDEDAPDKLYTLVTYVPVATFKNLQTVNEDENC